MDKQQIIISMESGEQVSKVLDWLREGEEQGVLDLSFNRLRRPEGYLVNSSSKVED